MTDTQNISRKGAKAQRRKEVAANGGGFVMLTPDIVRSGLAGFATRHIALSEAELFHKRAFAETMPWHWAWDALIHWKRGNRTCAVTSWRYAMRLTLAGAA